MPWSELPMPNKQSLYRKTLLANGETGTGVDLLRYPAGVITPAHTHPHGHGMYVLQGSLVTNHGTFGPGMFVWFPDGERIYHGATKEADTVVLFIRHEPFQIDFVDSAGNTKGN
jgi:quercetin dioxygenase-like cupin family protein